MSALELFIGVAQKRSFGAAAATKRATGMATATSRRMKVCTAPAYIRSRGAAAATKRRIGSARAASRATRFFMVCGSLPADARRGRRDEQEDRQRHGGEPSNEVLHG
jgi:hypothetical protein